jgi:hypothetical protein
MQIKRVNLNFEVPILLGYDAASLGAGRLTLQDQFFSDIMTDEFQVTVFYVLLIVRLEMCV